MRGLLKFALVYVLIVPLGFGVSVLYGRGALHGDYIADIKHPVSDKKSPNQKPGHYIMNVPPSEIFALREAAAANQRFHHTLMLQGGKLVIFKECPIDTTEDPVENSCRMIWAYI